VPAGSLSAVSSSRHFSPLKGTYFSDDDDEGGKDWITPRSTSSQLRPRIRDMRRASSVGALTTRPVMKRASMPAVPRLAPAATQRSSSPTKSLAHQRHSLTTAFTPTPAMQEAASPSARAKGSDVSVCVRLRPGPRSEMCIFKEGGNCVHLHAGCSDWGGRCQNEAVYSCDHAFGPEAPQEDVYEEAVAPICEAVLEGYNGAVIAYGQTGSGKTHTIVGTEQQAGVIPRAVATIFSALRARKHWSVEVSVLEIYNERARDLLSPAPGVTQVDIHEVLDSRGVGSFHCPDATRNWARTPEEALASLYEGLERRETARTDMNHNSSRSHLIFTLSTEQSDDAVKAKLRGRLHLVDLAGSERLKRSMASTFVGTPKSPRDCSAMQRDQRREAGAINKSLMHLALVIHRLTQASSCGLRHVPYRDSMLTRLLADSFGGSSKTCLIITCSSLAKDRDETHCALEFGKRAGLVKNMAEINIEMQQEVSDVVRALVAKELAAMRRENESVRRRLREAAAEAVGLQKRHMEEVQRLEEEKGALERRWLEATATAAEIQEESAAEISRLQADNLASHRQLRDMHGELARAEELMRALACSSSSAAGASQQAEEQHYSYAEKSTERAAVLRRSLTLATSDVAKITKLREARLACLEAEGREFERRWGCEALGHDSASEASGGEAPDLQAGAEVLESPEGAVNFAVHTSLALKAGAEADVILERDPELTPVDVALSSPH